MSSDRFTAWLSSDERDALRQVARENGCSENFVVRMAVRALLFDLPIPDYLRKAVQRETSSASR